MHAQRSAMQAQSHGSQARSIQSCSTSCFTSSRTHSGGCWAQRTARQRHVRKRTHAGCIRADAGMRQTTGACRERDLMLLSRSIARRVPAVARNVAPDCRRLIRCAAGRAGPVQAAEASWSRILGAHACERHHSRWPLGHAAPAAGCAAPGSGGHCGRCASVTCSCESCSG